MFVKRKMRYCCFNLLILPFYLFNSMKCLEKISNSVLYIDTPGPFFFLFFLLPQHKWQSKNHSSLNSSTKHY